MEDCLACFLVSLIFLLLFYYFIKYHCCTDLGKNNKYQLSSSSSLLLLYFIFSVFIRKHRQISDVIRKVVMQMLFDSERLERYFIERINQYSIDTNISQSIANAMKSPKAQTIINDHLNELYSGPEAYYLVKLGVTRDKVRPMIAPAVLSLCAETGPSVLGEFFNRNNVSCSF